MKLINLGVATESHTAGSSVVGREDGVIGLSGMAVLFPRIPLYFQAARKWTEKTAAAKTKVDVEDVNRSCETDLIKNLFSVLSSIYIDTLKEPFIVLFVYKVRTLT